MTHTTSSIGAPAPREGLEVVGTVPAVLAGIDALVAEMRADAEQRREKSANDTTADVTDFWARRVAQLRALSADDEEISVQEYAQLHQKSPSTIRRWCQLGYIAARPVGKEYRIRRGEPTPRLRSA